VSVACVESRRWGPSVSTVRQEGRVPPSVISTMRSVDVTRGDVQSLQFRQERTWNRITTLSSRGATSRTNSLIEIMEGLSQKSHQGYQPPRVSAEQSGVLVALDGYPLLLEVFDSSETLAQHIGPLVKSTLLDSSGTSERLASDSQIEQFLNRILRNPVKSNGVRQSSEQFSTTTANLTSRLSSVEGAPMHSLSINMKHPSFN
jgi:hypothetical protein